MKTAGRFLPVLGLTALLLFCSCASQQNRLEYITQQAAQALALEASGHSAAEASVRSATLENRNGTDYYRIEFDVNGRTYRCDIDALTGTVIEMSGPSNAEAEASGGNSAEAAGTENNSSSEPQQTSSSGAPQSAVQTETSAGDMLTEKEAKSKALSHAGLGSTQVTFISCQLEHDDGRQIYEIEFYNTADRSEYDYEIDAYTGAVIKYDYDAEYYDPPSKGSTITASKAREIALAQVPGASSADIREFETDYDDGHLEYEGKIIYSGMEYEFTIDGYSGAIREWEAESL